MVKPETRNRKLGTGIARGQLKLKPTQIHKTKKTYNRKKIKKELKSLIKTAS